MDSIGDKFKLYLISTYLSEVFVAEYLREININFYTFFNVCLYFIVAMKKYSKRKETEIENKMVEVFKYTSNRWKKAGK